MLSTSLWVVDRTLVNPFGVDHCQGDFGLPATFTPPMTLVTYDKASQYRV